MTKSYGILKRSRISTKKFREILKYFSLDIEATKVAQLTGLNRNTVNKYLLLVRKRIAKECELESPISGDIEVDESFLEPGELKEKEVAEPVEKPSSSGCSNVREKYTRKLFLTAPEPGYRRWSGARWAFKALSTRMGGKAMTAWLTWVIKNIIGFNMETTNLQTASPILTELKTSGALLKCAWQNSGDFLNLLFICILKSVSLGSTIEARTSINYYWKLSKNSCLTSHEP